MWRITWITAFLCMLSTLSVSLTYAQDERVVAIVGNKKITLKDLNAEIGMYGKSGNFSKKLMTLTPEGRKKILDKMVMNTLFLQEAINEGVKLDEESEKYLKRLRQNLIVKGYIQKVLKESPFTEIEMRNYYEKHIEKFVVPEKRRIRHIVIKTEQEAEKILEKLKAGGDFAELAGRYNIDGTKKKAGDLNWIKRKLMVKEFDDVAFKLKKDEISDIVKTNFGYHIIKAEDIKPPERKRYEDVKREIKRKIEEERIIEIEESLKTRFKVKIIYDVLEDISKENNKGR